MNNQQIKADAGKLRISLVPTGIIRAIARVREYGVSKTGENGVCETQSYCVRKCPEFVPDRDQRRRGIG